MQDYLAYEREDDAPKWKKSPALFLPPSTVAKSAGELTILVIYAIWNEVAALAQMQGKTPHSARHVMGPSLRKRATSRQCNHN